MSTRKDAARCCSSCVAISASRPLCCRWSSEAPCVVAWLIAHLTRGECPKSEAVHRRWRVLDAGRGHGRSPPGRREARGRASAPHARRHPRRVGRIVRGALGGIGAHVRECRCAPECGRGGYWNGDGRHQFATDVTGLGNERMARASSHRPCYERGLCRCTKTRPMRPVEPPITQAMGIGDSSLVLASRGINPRVHGYRQQSISECSFYQRTSQFGKTHPTSLHIPHPNDRVKVLRAVAGAYPNSRPFTARLGRDAADGLNGDQALQSRGRPSSGAKSSSPRCLARSRCAATSVLARSSSARNRGSSRKAASMGSMAAIP